jgi:N-methylhydantoinase B
LKDERAIELSITEGAFRSIADEMSASLRRSSYSPIIRDMLDYSCALFDAQGLMIAQAETIPVQLGFLGYGLRSLIKYKGIEWFEKGDIVALNHPFRGGNHTPDVQIFKPLFFENKLVGFAANTAHHLDFGGCEPGTEGFDNREIFQEGLLLSGVKLFVKGEPNQQVFEIIKENVRDPIRTMGDLRAQIASNNLGEARFKTLLEKWGLEKMMNLIREFQDYTEKLVTTELENIPNGSSHAIGFMDDDGIDPNNPIKIEATIIKKGISFTVDFTGSSKQTNTGMNLPLSNAYSAAYYALRALLKDQSIPQNDGCYRHVEVIAPEGTIVNPKFPAAVSARHVTAQRQIDTVLRALTGILPERICAGCNLSFPTFNCEALSENGKIIVTTDILGGGYGGNIMWDGMDAVDSHGSNCALLPAEICEADGALKVIKTELVRDSGGAGKFRGGLAIARTYEIIAEEAYVNLYADQGKPENSPWPLFGGLPGSPAKIFVTIVRNGKKKTKRIFPLKKHLYLKKGDRFTLVSCGGGGYGDPKERDPELVIEDVLNGKISRKVAEKIYNVSINSRRIDEPISKS